MPSTLLVHTVLKLVILKTNICLVLFLMIYNYSKREVGLWLILTVYYSTLKVYTVRSKSIRQVDGIFSLS